MAVCGIGIGWRIGLEYPFRIVAADEKAVMVIRLGFTLGARRAARP